MEEIWYTFTITKNYHQKRTGMNIADIYMHFIMLVHIWVIKSKRSAHLRGFKRGLVREMGAYSWGWLFDNLVS